MRCLTVVKAEGSGIVIQEVDKTVNDDVAWSHGGAVQRALHDDIFSGLELILAIWAAKGGVGEEPLTVLADGGITYVTNFIQTYLHE